MEAMIANTSTKTMRLSLQERNCQKTFRSCLLTTIRFYASFFSRMVIKAAPSWEIRQASNGEAALFLADMEDANYDLIFVDMYMASVEAQMLGTETVEALRAKGVMCRICGLSANDKEKEFMEAGADSFTFKPLPCETRALTRELCRILYQDTP
mmetsp:Transcript_19343/g.32128  ORF Transcript_19343/g.32128 Transcript_19343/m.32128 type:complete len:154 (-) Transcript_19343:172-633(-)